MPFFLLDKEDEQGRNKEERKKEEDYYEKFNKLVELRDKRLNEYIARQVNQQICSFLEGHSNEMKQLEEKLKKETRKQGENKKEEKFLGKKRKLIFSGKENEEYNIISAIKKYKMSSQQASSKPYSLIKSNISSSSILQAHEECSEKEENIFKEPNFHRSIKADLPTAAKDKYKDFDSVNEEEFEESFKKRKEKLEAYKLKKSICSFSTDN